MAKVGQKIILVSLLLLSGCGVLPRVIVTKDGRAAKMVQSGSKCWVSTDDKFFSEASCNEWSPVQ